MNDWKESALIYISVPFYNSENPDSMKTKHQFPYASQRKHAGEKAPPLAIVPENSADGEHRNNVLGRFFDLGVSHVLNQFIADSQLR